MVDYLYQLLPTLCRCVDCTLVTGSAGSHQHHLHVVTRCFVTLPLCNMTTASLGNRNFQVHHIMTVPDHPHLCSLCMVGRQGSMPHVTVYTKTTAVVTSEVGDGIKKGGTVQGDFNLVCNVQLLEFTVKMCLCAAGPCIIFHSSGFILTYYEKKVNSQPGPLSVWNSHISPGLHGFLSGDSGS